MATSRASKQSGQVLVLVALALLALIGATALVLLAGSVEWQRNQLQELADSTALDAALAVGVGCDAVRARAVITEADLFLSTRRTPVGGLPAPAGSCAATYTSSHNFAGRLTATYNYPYRAHQQQVEVILTLTLPISFGGELGANNITVSRRAVAEGPQGSVPAVSAATFNCRGGQVNISGSVSTSNTITRNAGCAVYAHMRLDPVSGTYSDLGNVRVYATGQSWLPGGARCRAQLNNLSVNAVCADGYELGGHAATVCGPAGSEYLWAADRTVNANPCAAGVAPQPVPALSANLPPEPNQDPAVFVRLPGGIPCNAGAFYTNIVVGGRIVGSSIAGTPPPVRTRGFWHFRPSCYGYIDVGPLNRAGDLGAVLDPGFYYFNGSQFGGQRNGTLAAGGGICLNGRTLLARDVTLEFVNRAGFSTGTCTAGAGNGQFGSEPCSLRPCPPNVRADPPINYTWFSAPCTLAPPGALDAASCPAASAWCRPPGERSCSNVLIWAPRGIGGQITIAGGAARAWLLGSISWPGTITDTVNGTSRIAGAVSCTTLSITAPGNAAAVIGGDYGVSTALSEAQLIE